MSSDNDTTEPDGSGAAMTNDASIDFELQAIRTQISTLPNQIVGPTLETVHTYLKPLHDNVRQLESLVADQLDVIQNVVFEQSSSAVQTEVVLLLRPVQDALLRVESQIAANQDSLGKSTSKKQAAPFKRKTRRRRNVFSRTSRRYPSNCPTHWRASPRPFSKNQVPLCKSKHRNF